MKFLNTQPIELIQVPLMETSTSHNQQKQTKTSIEDLILVNNTHMEMFYKILLNLIFILILFFFFLKNISKTLKDMTTQSSSIMEKNSRSCDKNGRWNE